MPIITALSSRLGLLRVERGSPHGGGKSAFANEEQEVDGAQERGGEKEAEGARLSSEHGSSDTLHESSSQSGGETEEEEEADEEWPVYTARDPTNMLGRRVEVQWQNDLWYGGLVTDYDPVRRTHCVVFDDGDVAWRSLAELTFRRGAAADGGRSEASSSCASSLSGASRASSPSQLCSPLSTPRVDVTAEDWTKIHFHDSDFEHSDDEDWEAARAEAKHACEEEMEGAEMKTVEAAA